MYVIIADKVKGCLDLWHQPDLDWTSKPVPYRLFWEINIDSYKSGKKVCDEQIAVYPFLEMHSVLWPIKSALNYCSK